MTAFLIVFGFFFSLLFFVGTCAYLVNGTKDFIPCAIIFIIISSILWWALYAEHKHAPTPVITYHKILEIDGVKYYSDNHKNMQRLYGDARFVNPNEVLYKITVVSGGWSCGLYVSESSSTELIRIDQIEQNKELEK